MIVIDAFYADSIPFHLATREFLQLVRERLAPGGVVVVNIIGAITGERVQAAPLADEDLQVLVPDRAALSGLRQRRRPSIRPTPGT